MFCSYVVMSHFTIGTDNLIKSTMMYVYSKKKLRQEIHASNVDFDFDVLGVHSGRCNGVLFLRL